MADVNANIGVNIDTSGALAQLKALQREIARFHASVSRSSESATLAQRNLQRTFIDGINSIGAFSAELRTIKTTSESFTDSLEKNKFSMREYFRYAGAATKTFGKLFKSEYDTIGKVAEDRVKKLQTQYIKMGRDASGAMKAIAVIPNELDMKNLGTQTQIAAQRQAIFNQLVKQGSTNLLNFGKNTQWAGRQLMVGFTLPLVTLGSVATKTFMQMETAAIKFRKVYGDLFTPASETNAALENIKALGDVFTRYGIAVSDTVSLAAEAAAAGFQGVDLQRQVTEATRLQVLGQVEQQKALETTISLQNAFRMSSEDLANAINFLNAVENQTVVSLDDITTAIPKAAPIIQELGGNVKDLAFFLAAMKEGGINASEGANALKSGLASLINPTEKASNMLSGFGININQIVEKNVGNVRQTVIDFALALENLSDLNRQRAIEQLFGKFQQARLSALFSNVIRDGNQAARVFDLAGASAEDLAALAEQELGITADSAMNKFRSSVEQLKISLAPLGEIFLQIVTPMIDSIGSLIEKFNNLPQGAKKVIATLVTVVGGIAPVILMTIGLLANFVANGIKGLNLLRNGFLKLTGQSQILGEQTNFLTEEQAQAAAVAHSLDQSHARLVQTFTAEAGALRALTAEYQKALAVTSAFALRNPGMMRGPVPGFKGGIVSVPGSGTEDKYPAMLAAGEAVIPAKQNKKYAALIQGIIADNIPGFKQGNLKGLAGGQERLLAPYSLFATGNTPGNFGMSRGFLNTDDFSKSLNITAIAAGSIEGNIRLTDKAILEMAQEVDPYSKQIVEQLRIAAKEMADSGKAATHISELFEKKQAEIKAILSNLSATGKRGQAMSSAFQQTFYPTKEQILAGGNVRVPGVDIDESGRVIRSTQRSFRTGKAAAFQKKSKRVFQNIPLDTTQGRLTRAHVVPEDLVLPGKVRPLSGGALSMPIEKQMAGRKEIERKSAIVSQNLGKSDAVAYNKGRIAANIPDMYVETRKRTSPHPLAPKDGKDDAIAYSNAMDKELSNRKRRRATSPGGTVGEGGNIIPPIPPSVASGAADAGGRRSIGQRLAGFKTKFATGRFAGAGMAGSMGIMAASMLPGKMGELASKIMPVVFGFQALQMILKFLPGPLKLFSLGIGATIGIIKLVNAARERERLSLEGLSDAMSTTEKQVKSLGDFFGVAPTKLPFDIKSAEVVAPQVRSQRESLKADPRFQAEFKNTIESLRKATNDEAMLVFSSLALNLRGQGFAEEQVQVIIDALREESKQTDVTLDVKSLDLSPKSIKGIKDSLNKVLNSLKAEMEKPGAITGGVFKQQLSDPLKKQLNTVSGYISKTSKSLAGMFQLGLISGKKYEKSLTGILEVTNGLDVAQKQLLLNKVFDQLGVNASTFLGKLTDVKQEVMLIALLSSGVLTKESTVIQDLMATGEDAELRRSRGIYGLTKAYEAFNAVVKKVNEEDKKTGGGGTTENLIAKQTDALNKQITTYRLLRNAKIDVNTASELAANSEIAALLQTDNQVKKNLANIKEYAKAKKELANIDRNIEQNTVATARAAEYENARLQIALKYINLQEQIVDMQNAPTMKRYNDQIEIQEAILGQIEDRMKFISRTEILPRETLIKKNNYQLEKISLIEDEINQRYDDQEKALANILEANQQIVALERARISVADALTKGDISAAAQAAQEFKAQSQSATQDRQSKMLQQARELQIRSLGRLELEKQNKVLQQQIAFIQQDQLDGMELAKADLQDQIDLIETAKFNLEKMLETQKQSITYFGMNKQQIQDASTLLQAMSELNITPDISGFSGMQQMVETFVNAAKGDVGSLNTILNTSLPQAAQMSLNKLQELRQQAAEYLDLTGTITVSTNKDGVIADLSTVKEKWNEFNKEVTKAATTLVTTAQFKIDQTSYDDFKNTSTEVKTMVDKMTAAVLDIFSDKIITDAEIKAFAEKFGMATDQAKAMLNGLMSTWNGDKDSVRAASLSYFDSINKALQGKLDAKSLEDFAKAWGIPTDAAKKYFTDVTSGITGINSLDYALPGNNANSAWTNANSALQKYIELLGQTTGGKITLPGGTGTTGSQGTGTTGSQGTGTTGSQGTGTTGSQGQGGALTAAIPQGPGLPTTPAPGPAWISDGKGGWTKPLKPLGEFLWDDTKGWYKDVGTTPTVVDERTKLLAMGVIGQQAEIKTPATTGAVGTIVTTGLLGTGIKNPPIRPPAEAKGGLIKPVYRALGGMINFLNGGFAKGTDTVPAMLSPGEFVMSRYAVQNYGVDKMKAINNGESGPEGVYNYSINVNVKSDSNPDDIARAVMTQIKRIDSQRIRGQIA